MSISLDEPDPYITDDGLCSVTGCDKSRSSSKRLCHMHYRRLRVNGSPFISRHPHERHGLRNLAEYRIWKNMKHRCLNASNAQYKDYGGRGIKIHPTWARSFPAFLVDVGRRPDPLLTLDRIDNDGDYVPSNVRWTDRATQAHNSRKRVDNTSGYRGVHYNKFRQCWLAYLNHGGKRVYARSFDTLDEAVKARRAIEEVYS